MAPQTACHLHMAQSAKYIALVRLQSGEKANVDTSGPEWIRETAFGISVPICQYECECEGANHFTVAIQADICAGTFHL